MSRDELLNKLAVIINQDADSLRGPERLEDLEDWDSLAVLSVISLLDEQFHVVVPATRIHEAQTIDDIVKLVGDKLTS